MDATVTLAAFTMGAMGSLHCALMCGPLSGVLCSTKPGRSARGAISLTQLGRLTTYAAFGALAGTVGEAVGTLVPPTALRLMSRLAVAAVLLGVGLYLAGVLRPRGLEGPGRLLERARTVLFGWLGSSPLAQWFKGVLWGTLPCGLLYGAVALALTSGSALGGAAAMTAFFAGTLPSLLLASWVGKLLRTRTVSLALRRAVGVILIASGGLHVALAVLDSGAVPTPREGLRPCCAARQAAASAAE